jgi:hypothetical protein
MRFHFKTLEEQAREFGFKFLGVFHSYSDMYENKESRIFNEHVMKDIAQHLERLVDMGDSYKNLFFQVRKSKPSFGGCNCNSCLRGYEIILFGAE